MFNKLKRLLQGAPPPVADKIEHPVLGTLRWSVDDEAWISGAAHAGIGFEFVINGTPEPAPVLLTHAADIIRKKDEFVTEVLACIKSEGETIRSFRGYRDEIAGLAIEQVWLFWPDRPDDGMISLSGGRNFRLWRCDLIARRPKGLGFDS